MSNRVTHFVKHDGPGHQARVELVNGRIVDVVKGRAHPAGTRLILHGGRIESMPGRPGEFADLKPDFTIDLQGRTVLPGLFNTHCHLIQFEPTMILDLSDMRLTQKNEAQQRVKTMAECLAHGITHVRDAWHPDLRKNRAMKEQIARGEMPGPRILQAVVVGPAGSYMQEDLSFAMKMTGMPHTDPTQDYGGAVAFPIDATEAQVRAAVDRAIDERGAEVIKIGDETYSLLARKSVPVMTTAQLCALADQARRRGLQATMHHSSVESFRRGTKAGVASLAHVPWDAMLTDQEVQAFKATGAFIEPTVSAFYGMLSWQVAGSQWNDDPELIRLTEFRDSTYTYAAIAGEYYVPALRTVVLNGQRRCASGKPKMMGIMDMSAMVAWSEKTATYYENFRLLFDHGVPMATGNDNKPPCTPATMDLEVLMFDHLLKSDPDRAPFTGAEACKIATIHSARSLGLERDFGTIEPGKIADLVILDGDPLQDFRLVGSPVAALFMDGVLTIDNCGLEVRSSAGL